MKASQAGRVLGTALGDASDWVVCEGEDPENINAKLCTTVMVFVNLSDYQGQPVELAMAERDASLGADGLSGTEDLDGAEQGLSSENTSIRLASAMPTKQENILEFLKEIRDKQGENPQSEVFTGRVAATHDIITPTLFADTIFAKTIKADSIEGLEIFTDKIGSLDAKYQALSESVTVSGEGDAESLKVLSLDSAEVKIALNVLGDLTAEGGLVVGGEAEFNGDTVFNKLATFFGITTFKDTVLFEKAPVFSKDTAGFAVIKKGQREVRVTFEQEYSNQPIVTVTPTNDRNILLEDGEADESLQNDIQALENQYQETFFESDIKYLITNKHKNGFTIVLNGSAPQDMAFSWAAFAVEDSSISYSDEAPVEEGGESEPATEQEEPVTEENPPANDITQNP